MTRLARVLFGALAACVIVDGTAAVDKKSQAIRDWGLVIDPLGDCTITEEGGKLTIEVPGRVHGLNASLGGQDAPRVLREVDGDFTAEVKVIGDFKPGRKSAIPQVVAPFNGAGLLLWQDKQNYLRLERNAFWIEDAGSYACYPPLVEYYQDGKFQETNPPGTLDEFFKGKATWLKLKRQGKKVVASYSHDGEEWQAAKQIEVELPRKLQIGVASVNSSIMPFVVKFKEFKVSTK
jgi:regulation of enolase protein 1 (concanavalin A-like superfamily)